MRRRDADLSKKMTRTSAKALGVLGALSVCAVVKPVSAVNKASHVPASNAEVPYPVGYLMKLQTDEVTPGYGDCQGSSGDEPPSFDTWNAKANLERSSLCGTAEKKASQT